MRWGQSSTSTGESQERDGVPFVVDSAPSKSSLLPSWRRRGAGGQSGSKERGSVSFNSSLALSRPSILTEPGTLLCQCRGMSRSSTIPDQVELPLLGTTSSSAPLRPRHRRPSLVRLLSRIALPVVTLTFLSLVYLSSTGTTGSRKEEGIDLKVWMHRNGSNVNVLDNLEIQSEDGNMKAVFFGELSLYLPLPFLAILDGKASSSFFPPLSRSIDPALGASMNELHVRDRNGKMRDIIVGCK